MLEYHDSARLMHLEKQVATLTDHIRQWRDNDSLRIIPQSNYLRFSDGYTIDWNLRDHPKMSYCQRAGEVSDVKLVDDRHLDVVFFRCPWVTFQTREFHIDTKGELPDSVQATSSQRGVTFRDIVDTVQRHWIQRYEDYLRDYSSIRDRLDEGEQFTNIRFTYLGMRPSGPNLDYTDMAFNVHIQVNYGPKRNDRKMPVTYNISRSSGRQCVWLPEANQL